MQNSHSELKANHFDFKCFCRFLTKGATYYSITRIILALAEIFSTTSELGQKKTGKENSKKLPKD